MNSRWTTQSKHGPDSSCFETSKFDSCSHIRVAYSLASENNWSCRCELSVRANYYLFFFGFRQLLFPCCVQVIFPYLFNIFIGIAVFDARISGVRDIQ